MKEAKEPLAKFHAQVLYNGRISIPENTRLRYGIEKGDYVEIIIRKVGLNNGPILGRGHFVARVSNKGLITIPKGLRSELNIKEKDVVEIVLIDYFKITALLGNKSKRLSKIIKKGYEILDEESEKELLIWH
jgi:AbrB family looped-hinge helix DNA binding protein